MSRGLRGSIAKVRMDAARIHVEVVVVKCLLELLEPGKVLGELGEEAAEQPLHLIGRGRIDWSLRSPFKEALGLTRIASVAPRSFSRWSAASTVRN